ncbi:MAG: lamin tail domain-containing protein [Chloroflexi bacterium]|nr:lamin tail domain-containing protein [Chloroflexota bacterium]
MQRRAMLFLIANVALSIVVALGVISLFGQQLSGGQPQQVIVTVPLIITATAGSTQTPWLITATPQPGTVILPTGLVSPAAPAEQTQVAAAGNVQTQNTTPAVQGATINGTPLPANCIIHIVEPGDAPFALGEIYGVSGFDIMEANGLTEETATRLQVGQELIIPLEGCTLTAPLIVPTPTPEAQESSADTPGAETTAEAGTPTATPTVTLAPTAVNAQVTIVSVVSAGDVTAEGVEIRNNGALVDMTGWTLADADGNTFTFPRQLVFTGGQVTVYTRVGENSPIALFWNRSTAVWGQGDVVTLRDEDGMVQATFRIQRPGALP